MNRLIALLLTAFILNASGTCYAKDLPTKESQPNQSQLIEQGHYVNKNGQEVHSPAHTKTDKTPNGATAKCADGTYSFSQSRRGTCSHHGGVMQWLN